MEHAWEEIGLDWVAEPVSKQAGPNASDRTEYRRDAQIAVVTDLDKFVAHFGPAAVLGSLDGTSVRVMCQGVNRDAPRNATTDVIRDRIYNRLKGIRTRGPGQTRTIEIVKIVREHPLPDGSKYEGTDETEYQQLYAGALVEAGVETGTALAIARTQTL